ncbi:MAG: GNAT family N-acetyltransferase [Hyphomonadaceae bacterium]
MSGNAGQIPWTRTCVSQAEEARIRTAVRETDAVAGGFSRGRVLRPGDAASLLRLFEEPTIGPVIYTLPRPLTHASVLAFIRDHLDQRARGEGILVASFNADDQVSGYFDVELWPQWGAAKFGGAVSSARQGRGFGAEGGLAAIEWCFDVAGVHRLCETTAHDNHRSIRLLRRIGFVQLGEVVSVRPDGSTRPSLYWEMEREVWAARRQVRKTG